jgi:hypothetical protein
MIVNNTGLGRVLINRYVRQLAVNVRTAPEIK